MSRLTGVKIGATIIGLVIIGFIIWKIVTHQSYSGPPPTWGGGYV